MTAERGPDAPTVEWDGCDGGGRPASLLPDEEVRAMVDESEWTSIVADRERGPRPSGPDPWQ